MRTARSLIVSPYLVVSHTCPPWEQPHTPSGATTHTPPEQPWMPPGATAHAPPEQPCMPLQSNHTCPPQEQLRMPPLLTESQTGVKT